MSYENHRGVHIDSTGETTVLWWNISYETLACIGDGKVNFTKNIMVSLFKCSYKF